MAPTLSDERYGFVMVEITSQASGPRRGDSADPLIRTPRLRGGESDGIPGTTTVCTPSSGRCSALVDGQPAESDAIDLDDRDGSTDQVLLDHRERMEGRVDSLVDAVADAAEQQHAGSAAPEMARIVPKSVGRDQDTLLARGVSEHVAIGRALHPIAGPA